MKSESKPKTMEPMHEYEQGTAKAEEPETFQDAYPVYVGGVDTKKSPTK